MPVAAQPERYVGFFSQHLGAPGSILRRRGLNPGPSGTRRLIPFVVLLRLVAYDCSYPQCGAVFATKKCLQRYAYNITVVSERWKQISRVGYRPSIRHVAVHEDSFECAIDESCGETFKTYVNESVHGII